MRGGTWGIARCDAMGFFNEHRFWSPPHASKRHFPPKPAAWPNRLHPAATTARIWPDTSDCPHARVIPQLRMVPRKLRQGVTPGMEKDPGSAVRADQRIGRQTRISRSFPAHPDGIDPNPKVGRRRF